MVNIVAKLFGSGSQVEAQNNFKDDILQDIGEIPVSNTQKIRVLKVKDYSTGKVTLSVQKWWRAGKQSEWVVGKGFKIDSKQAKELAELIALGEKTLN